MLGTLLILSIKSQVKVRFPAGTMMRLFEQSHLKMSDLAFNNETQSKNINVELSVGKL
jgi:hypothetical protein